MVIVDKPGKTAPSARRPISAMLKLLSPVEILDRLEALSFTDLGELADYTSAARNDAEYIVAASEWFHGRNT